MLVTGVLAVPTSGAPLAAPVTESAKRTPESEGLGWAHSTAVMLLALAAPTSAQFTFAEMDAAAPGAGSAAASAVPEASTWPPVPSCSALMGLLYRSFWKPIPAAECARPPRPSAAVPL